MGSRIMVGHGMAWHGKRVDFEYSKHGVGSVALHRIEARAYIPNSISIII